jgi:hypothetical protein
MNLYTVVLFSLTEPESIKKSNFKDWSLAVPIIFFIAHTRNGGTLLDQVPGLRVRVSDFPPIVLEFVQL